LHLVGILFPHNNTTNCCSFPLMALTVSCRIMWTDCVDETADVTCADTDLASKSHSRPHL